MEDDLVKNEEQLSAVDACIVAANDAHNQARRVGIGFYDRQDMMRTAYRNAMPRLGSQQDISDFIACVSHGMMFDYIDDKLGSKLLYAAQVAMTNLQRTPKPKTAAEKLHREETKTGLPDSSQLHSFTAYPPPPSLKRTLIANLDTDDSDGDVDGDSEDESEGDPQDDSRDDSVDE